MVLKLDHHGANRIPGSILFMNPQETGCVKSSFLPRPISV